MATPERHATPLAARWAAMAVGLAGLASGEFVWTVFRPDASAPVPSIGDALALSFYLFAYVTVVLLVRDRVVMFQAVMLGRSAVAAR